MLHGRWRAFAGRQADQGLFEGAGLGVAVAWREVPSGRSDDLVALDAAAPDAQPVAEAAAGGFDEAGAGGVLGHAAVGAERLAGLQRLDPAFHGRQHECQFKQACDDASHDAGAVALHQVERQRMAGDDLAGQGADLIGLAGVARRLAPGVGVGFVGIDDGFTLCRVTWLAGRQPGAGSVLVDGDRVEGGRLPALPGAGREQIVGAVGQEGVVGSAEFVQAEVAGGFEKGREIAIPPGGPGE